MSATINLLSKLKQHSNKDLLHAYVSYLRILEEALLFAKNQKKKLTIIHHRCGFCYAARVLSVNEQITRIMCQLHTQTGCYAYPVACGVFISDEPFNKWKGTYGKQRRILIAESAQTLKNILIERGYDL